jgi:hypothetical protein
MSNRREESLSFQFVKEWNVAEVSHNGSVLTLEHPSDWQAFLILPVSRIVEPQMLPLFIALRFETVFRL